MKFLISLLLVFCVDRLAVRSQPVIPELLIETGVHTASVWGIASDSKSRFVVTASEDKSLRIWDNKTGRLLNTIRPFRGKGNQGKLFCVDITADSRLIVAAGQLNAQDETSEGLYVFDRQKGEVVLKIRNIPGRVFQVRFSPDGKYILAGLERGKGLFLIETNTGKLIGTDTNYAGDIYGVAFDRSGKFCVSTSLDGNLRLYKVTTFQQGPVAKVTVGDQPYSVSFSPLGNQLLVGCLSKPKVVLYPFVNGNIGEAKLLDVSNLSTTLGSHAAMTCFSADGKFVYASGNSRYRNENQIIRSWQSATGKFLEDELFTTSSTILQLAPTSAGRILFATAASQWGIHKPGEGVSFETSAGMINFSGQARTLGTDEDGNQLKFRIVNESYAESIFSLTDLRLTAASAQNIDFRIPSQPTTTLSNWQNSNTPLIKGAPALLESNEVAYSGVVTGDSRQVFIGTDRFIRSYQDAGQLNWKLSTPEVVWALNLSKDNKTLIAALGDGTMRWYRAGDGKELLALFVSPDQRRWIAWMPSGYYACSVGGEELLGWQLNRGEDKAADFFPASQFRETYYKPELVRLALGFGTGGGIVKPENIIDKIPPVVTILTPESGALIESKPIRIQYNVRSVLPVLKTSIKMNGRPVDSEVDIKQIGENFVAEFSLPDEDCEVSVLVKNRFGFSAPAVVRLKGKAETLIARGGEQAVKQGNNYLTTSLNKPSLHVLSIGVSTYQKPDLKLGFAAKDADDIHTVFRNQEGKMYRKVYSTILTEQNATRENILEALKKLQTNTKTQDVAIVFMAGHGYNDANDDFFYLPVEADQTKLKETSLFYEDIRQHLADIKGKVVFLIDACHSGNVWGKDSRKADMVRLANISSSPENGIVVLSSSSAAQSSFEMKKWGNGVFTKAVLEGLSGGAALLKEDYITVKELDVYVEKAVINLTEGLQRPTTVIPNAISNFPIVNLK
jgi:WD40 repeat protein